MTDPLWKPRRRGRPLSSNCLVRCQVYVPSSVAEFMRAVEPEWAREVLDAQRAAKPNNRMPAGYLPHDPSPRSPGAPVVRQIDRRTVMETVTHAGIEMEITETYGMPAAGGPQTTTEATAMTEVYRNRTGTRRIYGTDYPIETIVWRKGPRQWVLWINQCNGACDYCNTYRTRREALTNAR